MKKFFPHFHFLLRHKVLMFVTLGSGIGASVMESIGLSLFFPLLQGFRENVATDIPFPFHYIVEPFQGLVLRERLQILALLFIGIVVAKGGMLIVKNICSIRIRMLVSDHFRTACFHQLLQVGMSYFNRQRHGDLHTIMGVYVNNMGVSISRFAQLIHLPFTVLFLVVMLLFLSWPITLISIFLTFFLMIIVRGIMRKTDTVGRTLAPVTNLLNSTLFDAILGMKVIRLFNREDDAQKKLSYSVSRFNDVTYSIGILQGLVSPLTEFAGTIIVAVIIFTMSFFVQQATGYGVETLLIFLLAFSRILSPLYAINQARVAFIGDLSYYREVFNFLNEKDKYYIKNGHRKFSGLERSIIFHDVEFRYSLEGPSVFKNISLCIEKGMKVGIVGSSGAGKSTFTELLLRFYDPQKGKILIDDVDLREFDIYSWRKCIGVVSQDVFLFNDTVLANIAYANPHAPMDQIEAVARKANAHEFIVTLPNGYHTPLGERGVLLSGGQRQRIAIARAIFHDPEILVFDEATSSLDSESEKIVQNALEAVSQGKTVITIAHRFSTIFNSDIIFVINNGKIVEQGKHADLLQKNGLYHKLVAIQKTDTSVSLK